MSTATILIVDDEPQIRRVMRTTLSSNGYAVIEAGKKYGAAVVAGCIDEDKLNAMAARNARNWCCWT